MEDDCIERLFEKYDLNLQSSPCIAETSKARIYKIALTQDPKQIRALKYYPYGPKESDTRPTDKYRATGVAKNWKLAKEHQLLHQAEIYRNLFKDEIYLVQKLWMNDTGTYIDRHTATKSA